MRKEVFKEEGVRFGWNEKVSLSPILCVCLARTHWESVRKKLSRAVFLLTRQSLPPPPEILLFPPKSKLMIAPNSLAIRVEVVGLNFGGGGQPRVNGVERFGVHFHL